MKRSGSLGLADKVDFLYGQTLALLAGDGLALAGVLALTWREGGAPQGIALAFALLWLWRLWLHRSYMHSPEPNAYPALSRRWLAWWNVGAVTSGVLWGAASWLLYPQADGVDRMALVLCLHGQCLVAVPVLATQSRVFLASTACSLGPLLVSVGTFASGRDVVSIWVLMPVSLIALVMGRKFRLGFDEALDRKARAEQLAEQLAASEAAARQGLAETRAALLAAASRAGEPVAAALGGDADDAAVALGPILDSLALDASPRAFGKGISLRFRGHRHAVHCDALVLEQVLCSMLECALRNTSYGGIIVAARPLGSFVRVQVWDTSEVASRIVDSEASAGESGGSSHAPGLSDLMTPEEWSEMLRCLGTLHASLRVRAIPGRGSLYELRVPRCVRTLLVPGQEVPDLRGRLHGASIVVIDEHAASRGELSELLQGWHAEVQAIDELPAQGDTPDLDPKTRLAIINVEHRALARLPELLAAVRQAVGARLPVLVVVPRVTAGLRRQALAARFNVIARPMRVDELRILVHYKLGLPLADRDPGFGLRLAKDGGYWSRALGLPMPTPRRIERIDQRGFLFQPASRLALQHSRGERRGRAHVVMIHGGISSVRGAMSGLLSPRAADTPWRTLPMLDDACVWRFEHDSYIPVMHNVSHLVAQIERHICAGQRSGEAMPCVALVAHSRGGVVARLAAALMEQRWPQVRFHAYTFGAPHAGTWVFRSFSDRWAGHSALVLAIHDAMDGVAASETTSSLGVLKRVVTRDLPVGYRDIEPDRVEHLLAPARHFDSYTTWSSRWLPMAFKGAPSEAIGRLLARLWGLIPGGDGVVPALSASGHAGAHHDATPVFHTSYFADERTRAQLGICLQGFLGSHGVVS